MSREIADRIRAGMKLADAVADAKKHELAAKKREVTTRKAKAKSKPKPKDGPLVVEGPAISIEPAVEFLPED